MPDATFQGDCDVDKAFKDQQIVFDTTFCGDVSFQGIFFGLNTHSVLDGSKLTVSSHSGPVVFGRVIRFVGRRRTLVRSMWRVSRRLLGMREYRTFYYFLGQ